MPSLKQLNDAVMAYIEDHPDDVITVVVDATFGHRIDPSGGAGVRRRGGEQRARVAPGRRHRAGRRLRAHHRQQGQRRHPLERLLPGVPRRVPVAVRRRPPVRRQARPPRGLGVRAPGAGARPDQPARHRSKKGTRLEPRKASVRPSKLASEPMPVPKLPPPTRRAEPQSGRRGRQGTPAPVAADDYDEAPAAACAGAGAQRRSAERGPARRHQRAAAVPRFRGSPSRRHRGRRHGRVVLVARRLRLHQRRRGATSRCATSPIPLPAAPARCWAWGSRPGSWWSASTRRVAASTSPLPGMQPSDLVLADEPPAPVKKAAKRTRKAAAPVPDPSPSSRRPSTTLCSRPSQSSRCPSWSPPSPRRSRRARQAGEEGGQAHPQGRGEGDTGAGVPRPGDERAGAVGRRRPARTRPSPRPSPPPRSSPSRPSR